MTLIRFLAVIGPISCRNELGGKIDVDMIDDDMYDYIQANGNKNDSVEEAMDQYDDEDDELLNYRSTC